MNSQQALALYTEAVAREREAWLYQHALNKVRVITRSMKAEEKQAYLASQAFQNTLWQVQRRDKVYQGLKRQELVQAWHREEFEHLAPLILQQAEAGLPVRLDFLRSVTQSRLTLPQARELVDQVEQGKLRLFLAEQLPRLTQEADRRVERFLRSRHLRRLLPGELKSSNIVEEVLETLFRTGLPQSVVNAAFHPSSPGLMLQNEIERAFPGVKNGKNIRLTDTHTVGEAVRGEVQQARGALHASLRACFDRQRLQRLLRMNPMMAQLQSETDARLEKERTIRSALISAIPEHYRDLYPLARAMRRRFVLHLGPTNSGKTYEGVQRLSGARHGIYLGPLRLLAAEQFETMNLADVPCSLVTGEEQIRVPGSRVQSSTVEMADLKARYDVAVIDECQMIADRDRGGAWTAALLGLCADEIHACASPDAEGLLTRMILECDDELTIVRHERMTPLAMEKGGFEFPSSVRPGDALIVFSKARVHAVAAELRSRGHRVSLIYGALPPDVRRDQADRFLKGETDVVVSTDAIAMGMNLPIQRVVFLESEKYDGDITRTLTDSEIKQIAGRAGRYGQYEVGYVNAFGFKGMVAQALARPLRPLTEAVIRFPESLLGIPLPLTEIINQWLNMQDKSFFSKASTVRMAALAAMMENRHTDKALLYRFLCIPFDETDPDLLARWKLMYHAEAAGEHLDVLPEMPPLHSPEECTIRMLDSLEGDYRRCDLYYNYVRLFWPDPDPLLEDIQRRKDLISQGIVHILSTQKLQQKTCRSCKRHLPWNWPWALCDACYRRGRGGFRGRGGGAKWEAET